MVALLPAATAPTPARPASGRYGPPLGAVAGGLGPGSRASSASGGLLHALVIAAAAAEASRTALLPPLHAGGFTHQARSCAAAGGRFRCQHSRGSTGAPARRRRDDCRRHRCFLRRCSCLLPASPTCRRLPSTSWLSGIGSGRRQSAPLPDRCASLRRLKRWLRSRPGAAAAAAGDGRAASLDPAARSCRRRRPTAAPRGSSGAASCCCF